MVRLITIVALGFLVGQVYADEHVFDFSRDTLNGPPRGFRSALAGSGPPGDWQILLDDIPTLFAPITGKSPVASRRAVLAQLSRDKTDERFPLLIYEGDTFDDFTLTTQFKMVAGEVEQMAGVAFRLQDERNFYYVRASALGTNLSFFKMRDGRLIDRVASTVAIPKGVWQELTVECQGNRIRGLLNGKELLLVTDTSGPDAFVRGKVGFWTKSDSVSYFVNARVTFRPKEPFAQALVRETLAKYPRLLGLKIYASANYQAAPQTIASNDPKEIGQAAPQWAKDVIAQDAGYYGKEKGSVTVALPLHDRNGEPIAAVKVVMKSFLGQTEKNAVARALPIVKQMEWRAASVKDLLQ